MKWDEWVEAALSKLESSKLLRSLRPINVSNNINNNNAPNFGGYDQQVFDGLREWDRASVEVQISESTFHDWLNEVPSRGYVSVPRSNEANEGHLSSHPHRKLLLFSGNDYLGLSAHPTVRMAAAKAAEEHGMGPRGSALICGYTDYHQRLEACLAELKKKEDCLLCPTGFAANMAVMVAIGSVASLVSSGKIPQRAEKVAVFSDALNHASIIDGLRLAERLHCVETSVYQHCNMSHLDALLSNCTLTKKVVVTDRSVFVALPLDGVITGFSPPFVSAAFMLFFVGSLFSMDGDFAPMVELARLRKKHGFLLVIDDAHGTFVCGRGGGGVAEEFGCEDDVDLCIGTLSKAAGCCGGFIACRIPMDSDMHMNS
ncbi:hypothetical protein Cgig2_018437 [Carnegiea gigantea]|uniref:Aminotransferase class I/classII large domain-containing protein n=1 Tax=Carnegiea gigantea TaxID=171969 RepID=A0A9Q1K6P5_9CARY|nr:hypothetical protein Cgig2_018437 [Carnegiea gigantea]